ncbi:unnamed protein product [Caenorhabditis bovis]|uniref:Golgi SNAP receptor complex member 2 n=1 Tax=Caenorhabditis bovis TaxID=2654633 RepID=A0A8S1EFZ4_9PELO|nr:unnamed protein product [Caenorhabditis bovis]
MERLYHDTNQLLQKVQIDLGRLETSQNEQDAQVIVRSIYTDLKSLTENCTRLDHYVAKEPPTVRQMARMKVEQLRSDVQRVDIATTGVHQKMTAKWRAASERQELLKQRFKANDTALSIGDHELQLNDRLQSSHRSLDDLISQGSSVLENLQFQHANLKGVRRKILDVGKVLGLSTTTLKVIDRRMQEDLFIFIIAAILFCIFMYVFYTFWKRTT